MLKRLQERINRQYGSKRGWLNHHNARLAGVAGKWRDFESVDWESVEHLVFVCMGNICRSPLAEAVARSEGYSATSAGIKCTPGMPADPRAIQFAEQNGYDLGSHRTTLLADHPLSRGDLVIGMEPRHLDAMVSVRGSIPSQQTLLGLWHPEPRPYLHDPYSTDEVYFQQCEQFVVEATQNLLKNLPSARREWKTSTRYG